MHKHFPLSPVSFLAAAALAALQGCATPPPAAEAEGTPGVAAAAPVAGGASAAGSARVQTLANGQVVSVAASPALPTFAAATKDARKIDGMMTMYQKEDKVWLELKPEDLNKPFFFSPKVSQGLGEPGYYGGSMLSPGAEWGAPQIVEFRRIHNLVQLVAMNDMFKADPGSPQAHAIAAGYSPSLLGSAAVASQPSPETKGFLIEANNLFLGDMLGMAIHLQQSYRQNYAYDARNSFFDYVRGAPDELVFEVTAHYATASIGVPAPNAPAGTPVPTVPSFVPDVRSLFLGLHYSLARLPEKPMQTRAADPRVGFFTTTVANFSDDLARTPRERYIVRWRLEKKDPDAPMSEPVKPIVYWLDKTIPLKYRDAISRGILEWNKAFERIGFKNAIVVQVQPDNASFDTLDVNAASVRWMVNAEPSYGAIGPHHIDPRTGEILDADIAIESLSSRNMRAQRSQVLDPQGSIDWQRMLQAAPGELAPLTDAAGVAAASTEADAWVQAYLTDVTMHEVGHTLGLRHNFRASRVYSDAQLSDPEFTKTHALSGSVMDYLPVNLSLQGQPHGTPFQSTLGPYDYWAIEYGYKVLPAGETAQQQQADLDAIAARDADRTLEYGTDEDAALGEDPDSLMFDLGDDPIAFAQKRFAIAAELFKRQEGRQLSPTEDYSVLRRSLSYALRDATRSAGVLLRQIGGVSNLRDHPGSGRDPMQPVPVERERAALETLVSGVLAPESYSVTPALQRRLAPDFLERGDASAGGEHVSTDYPVESVMLDFQRQLLAALMSDTLAQRLEDSAPKLDRGTDALLPAEVYSRLTRALWLDPANFGGDGKGDIPPRRRELQRDYVNRLANVLLRTPGGVRVDMRATLRAEAIVLLPKIQAAEKRPGLTQASRLHLADCAETLRVALAAPMQRAGF